MRLREVHAVAVTAVSPTFPAIELEVVRQVSTEIGAPLRIVETDQLEIDAFVQNDATRCYHCKTDLYQLLGSVQQETECQVIVDGTNVDDLQEDSSRHSSRASLGCSQPFSRGWVWQTRN